MNVMGEVAVIIPTISPNEGRWKVFKHIYVDLGQGELRDADDEKLKIHKFGSPIFSGNTRHWK